MSTITETERLIEEKVESGEYDSADEVVRQALRALSQEDEQYAIRLEALRGEIQKGIDSLNNGQHSPKDEVFARLRARRGRRSRGSCSPRGHWRPPAHPPPKPWIRGRRRARPWMSRRAAF